MFSKITAIAKSSQFWIGFAVGAVATAAFPKLRNIVAPVASKIPGASA